MGGTSRPSTHALCSSAENKTGRRTFLAFSRLYLRTFGPHRTPLALEDIWCRDGEILYRVASPGVARGAVACLARGGGATTQVGVQVDRKR